MFHRVKSEGQENEEIETQDNAEAIVEGTVAGRQEEINQQEEDAEAMSEEQVETTEEQGSGFSYRRPAQTAAGGRPAVGGYPGAASYGGGNAGYAAPRAEAPKVGGGSSSDRRLTIGSGITMSGEIESCDYLLVEGTVEAALKGANVLDIAESGTFYGTVEIGEANIAGRFEGDIAVHGRLTISSTGTVTGSIAYKELEIEAGAVIDGKLTPLSALPKSSAAPKPAAKKKAAPAKKLKPAAKADDADVQEAANNDGGLFSRTTAAAE